MNLQGRGVGVIAISTSSDSYFDVAALSSPSSSLAPLNRARRKLPASTEILKI